MSFTCINNKIIQVINIDKNKCFRAYLSQPSLHPPSPHRFDKPPQPKKMSQQQEQAPVINMEEDSLPWVYHTDDIRGNPMNAGLKYIGYALPETAFFDPSLDPTLHANWSQIPQAEHAQKKLASIVSILSETGKTRMISQLESVPNPQYTLLFRNHHFETVQLSMQVVFNDFITFTAPFENPAIARLHLTPDPEDHALYREILGDEITVFERLMSYTVRRNEQDNKAMILNLHKRLNPDGSSTKHFIFAAKSKKEIAKFLDHAFGIHIKYELERQKNRARADDSD
jgi:hypothetical protein